MGLFLPDAHVHGTFHVVFYTCQELRDASKLWLASHDICVLSKDESSSLATHFLTKGGAGVTRMLTHHGGAGFGHVGPGARAQQAGGGVQTRWAGSSSSMTSRSVGPAHL